jgi:uncharacterized membrane protein (UPF0182 family)
MDSMPASLRRHIRYPEDLFIIQAGVYGTYHMKDPEVFYNKEDLWSFPKESHKGQNTFMQPYYTIMRLPGEPREEFILMLPMVPNNRDNMIAWLAARCDGGNYGKLIEYAFSKEKLIYGPAQIEARIDQERRFRSSFEPDGFPRYSGNLLAIPIEDTCCMSVCTSAPKAASCRNQRLIASTEIVVMAQMLTVCCRAILAGGKEAGDVTRHPRQRPELCLPQGPMRRRLTVTVGRSMR